MIDQASPKVELLAPAGNFEKLEIAIHFGADAVYLAGKDFSLRNFSGNFTRSELKKAMAYARSREVKVYVACNTYARSHERDSIRDFLAFLNGLGPDAVIISDPGTLMLAREIMPKTAIHLSTQANTTNVSAARFWQMNGVKRVNAARELSLAEIETLCSESGMEIEAFVHGAMCISYSGRCLLSGFMANRDSNRGMCCHPCRFEYAVVEALRPGQYFPVMEDDRGTYIFNSRDLCMIDHLPRLISCGVASLKIEGRMKGIHYLATTVKTYRAAIDAYYRSPQTYEARPEWMEGLAKIGHRGYCTGFYLGDPEATLPNYEGVRQEDHAFIAKALKRIDARHTLVQTRNKFFRGDLVEVIGAQGPDRVDRVADIQDENRTAIPLAQPGSTVTIRLHHAASPHDLIRKVRK